MKTDISAEQIRLLVKKLVEAPDDKIELVTDGGILIGAQAKFDNGSVKFRWFYRDKVLRITVYPKVGYAIERDVPADGFFIFKLLNPGYNGWKAVKERCLKKIKNEKDKKDNSKIEEMSVIIDQIFPDEIEKQLGLYPNDK